MRNFKNILVTGGCGFIGSNFIRYIFNKTNYTGNIINIDKLTYAGNPKNLVDISKKYKNKRYFFEKQDICDFSNLENIFKKFNVDAVIHFAAESHVDRSIFGPKDFINTNIIGTFNLLEVSREFWKNKKNILFHHISCDEVFGSLGSEGFFYENTSYDPRSPYSASKASSDHIVKAYHHTYNLPVTLSNCSNNYGPYHFPEKLIPLMIQNIINEKPLPIYGDGKYIRDWLFVEDHVDAIWKIISNGRIGETYNVGGENEWENIKLVRVLCEKLALFKGKNKNYYKKLITFVEDRPGHDRRYAINCDKIKNELFWTQSVSFDEGLNFTIDWFLKNQNWVDDILSGDYLHWIKKNYNDR